MSSVGTSQEKERLMKALQLRKKQMEKRAADKTNRKAAEEKLSPIPDVNENKENLDRSQQESQRASRHASQQAHDSDRASARSEKGKEPLSELHPSAVPDSIQPSTEANHTSSDLSKPDSAADMTISDSDGDQSSNTSPPSTAATPSTDHKAPSATTPAPPAPAEPDLVQEDSGASSENEAMDGPSSTIADAPLANMSQATSETKSLLPQQSATPPASDKQEEQVAAEIPQSVPLPGSPPSTSWPTSAAESSTVVATGAPEPQHDMSAPEASNAVKQGPVEQKEKRKHHLEPIQVPTPDYSDDDKLSDDSFMDELQSATVEEAKPVSVGKSPLTPGFASNESNHQSPDPWSNSRAVSNPGAIGHQANLPAMSVGRSVSSPHYSEFAGSSSPVMMAKKINVSSGISNRIKALEKFSGRDQPSNPNQPAPSSAAFHETLLRQPSASGGGYPDSASASRRASHISEGPSCAPSVQRSASQLSTQHSHRQSSVSVTARIVRDPTGAPNDSTAHPTESNTFSLQSSELTIEHEAPAAPEAPKAPEAPLERTTTTDSMMNKSEKESMSTLSGGSRRPSLARMGRSDSRMSISSRTKGEAIPESIPASDVSSSPDEKRESRTSRMLRRMSSITSNSRRSIMGAKNPTVTEETASSKTDQTKQSRLDTTRETVQPTDIGEVNIQFPDTLLWKRRFMRIDDKGYLVLAPGNMDSSNRNMVKRYHLSEFMTPCLPDEDRQELPNSILLDFLSGSTLQAACESRQGQESVLQTLVDAYNAYQQ
ncbi:GPI-anchored cell surface glycoprotein [Aspergillus sp. HF37]|nr:GPI-anchored cell surface glycoprotein [Aspergillus sp. HF37]